MAGEGRLQAYLKRQCEARGVHFRKIKFEGRRDCPDVLLYHKGRVMFVELKNPNGKGRLSQGQVREISRMMAEGIDARVISKKEWVDVIIAELTQGKTTESNR